MPTAAVASRRGRCVPLTERVLLVHTHKEIMGEGVGDDRLLSLYASEAAFAGCVSVEGFGYLFRAEIRP